MLYGSDGGLTSIANQLWDQDSFGVLDIAEPGDCFGWSLAAGDFDADGYADVAIGAPFETIDSLASAGAVNVLYGSSAGLTATRDQLWHQASPGIAGAPDVGDRFGRALTSGDFDGDGYHDLAIGVPGEKIEGRANAGMLNVIYGSATGLTAAGNQTWHQRAAGIGETPEVNDSFGSVLAAGDFNNDGRDDVAIGVPFEDLGSWRALKDAGVVHVIYGAVTGLSASGSQIWDQNTSGVHDVIEARDRFGQALSVGDFDNDGYADLAIGVPGESVNLQLGAGAVHSIHGSSFGLTPAGGQIWHQDSPGILGFAEPHDRFGEVLAAGDFDHDGHDDLAIGVGGEDLEGDHHVEVDAGAINIIYGSDAGLWATGDQFWHQNSPGVSGDARTSDSFGSALAVGDFDGDGQMDLAIGVKFEGAGARPGVGAINVVYGAGAGLSSQGGQRWSQDSPGVLGTAEAGDLFGYSLQ